MLDEFIQKKEQLEKVKENLMQAKQRAEIVYWQTIGRIAQLEEIIKMIELKKLQKDYDGSYN